jgi:hypothetical protein
MVRLRSNEPLLCLVLLLVVASWLFLPISARIGDLAGFAIGVGRVGARVRYLLLLRRCAFNFRGFSLLIFIIIAPGACRLLLLHARTAARMAHRVALSLVAGSTEASSSVA